MSEQVSNLEQRSSTSPISPIKSLEESAIAEDEEVQTFGVTETELENRIEKSNEHRELPKGWIKRTDVKSGRVYYVDIESKPSRSIWCHPYDDYIYCASLPDSHPANPASRAAAEARAKQEELLNEAMLVRRNSMRSGTRRQSFTDRLFGTKEEREALKLEKEVKRMKEQQEEDVRMQEYRMNLLRREMRAESYDRMTNGVPKIKTPPASSEQYPPPPTPPTSKLMMGDNGSGPKYGYPSGFSTWGGFDKGAYITTPNGFHQSEPRPSS